MSLEYFTFGFREVRGEHLIKLEAFCEPHDDHLLKQVRALMPDLVADPAEGTCRIRISRETGEIDMVGTVRTIAARERAYTIAEQGALMLETVDEVVETLRVGIKESAEHTLEDLGLIERMELVKSIGDPKRKRAITIPDDIPFHAYAKTRAEEAVDSILAAAFSNTPDFPRA